LSATPVLHNERGFLAMLHLLDPANYPLDGIEAFRTKIESRQTLAEIVAGLVPENALYLDYTLDALTERFPNDSLLQGHVAKLRTVVEQMPSEDDPLLVEAIGRTRAHLSEVYRLHRRILRHRRRHVVGLTPDRAGARIHTYESADRRALTTAIEAWVFSEGVALSDSAAGSAKHRYSALWQALERASQYPASGAGIVGFVAQRAELVGDCTAFVAIAKLLGRVGLFEDRAAILATVLQEALEEGNKCVVFCTDSKTADALATYLKAAMPQPIERHNPQDEGWRRFNDDPKHSILVCDRRAEEGLNLQGGRKVVVHYDTPLNPNRIEQRMGRVDRYGSGDSVRSILLVCKDDPLEIAWSRYLDTALKLFDRSVASLQYLTDATVRSLPAMLFEDGTEALDRLVESHAGEDGRIETELRSIDQQDALDALGAPPTDLSDRLCEVDDDWREIAENTTLWLEQTLAFGRMPLDGARGEDDRASPFRYRYTTERGHTLIPLPIFMSACGESLDLTPDQRFGRAIKTVPFCFQRRAALSRRGRDAGMRLLRYGDPFLTGVSVITDADDRGRSFALWREDPQYTADQAADAYLRFDFVVEVDLTDAFSALVGRGEDGLAARAALRRRGDLMLAPSFSTIWIDSALNIVPQGGLRALLDRPYRPVARGQGAYHDINVNARRWRRVKAIGIDVVAHWAELCTKGRETAEALLRSDPDFVAKLRIAESIAADADYARITQLEVRLRQDPEGLVGQLDLERAIATATRQGIITPRIRLETIGAVFLTGSANATQRMMGGE
jgi:ATP-dependent helicase HepA